MDYKTLRAGDIVEWYNEETLISPTPKKGYKKHTYKTMYYINHGRLGMFTPYTVLTEPKTITNYIKKVKNIYVGVVKLKEYDDVEGNQRHYGYVLVTNTYIGTVPLPEMPSNWKRVIKGVQNK